MQPGKGGDKLPHARLWPKGATCSAGGRKNRQKQGMREYLKIIMPFRFISAKMRFVRIFAAAPGRAKSEVIMILNFKELNDRLSPKLAELVDYIYKVQGAELRRLDFAAAAKALNTDWTGIRRLCDRLEQKGVILCVGFGDDRKLRLSDDVIIAG